MVETKINGVRYGLRFDMSALEQIEDEFGSLKDMFDALKSGKQQTRLMKRLFLIMANCQRSYEGKPEDIGEDALKHARLSVLKDIRAALDEGMRVETMNGGEADDSVHDGYLDEIEAEEKKD